MRETEGWSQPSTGQCVLQKVTLPVLTVSSVILRVKTVCSKQEVFLWCSRLFFFEKPNLKAMLSHCPNRQYWIGVAPAEAVTGSKSHSSIYSLSRQQYISFSIWKKPQQWPFSTSTCWKGACRGSWHTAQSLGKAARQGVVEAWQALPSGVAGKHLPPPQSGHAPHLCSMRYLGTLCVPQLQGREPACWPERSKLCSKRPRGSC